MTNQQPRSLNPGEICVDYIPLDWPLTPLGARKDPYVTGWQNKPFTKDEIEAELLTGRCKAIGLISGPVYNKPYGLIWVDIDGPSVYQLVKELSKEDDFDKALPETLTICSGKLGRERKLYKISKRLQEHLIRNKYNWHGAENKEKLEVLWARHQGVLMGLHPETEGYFTAENMGFELVDSLPEFPQWLLNLIIEKNKKQGIPPKVTTRIVGPGFAINSVTTPEKDISDALNAMWATDSAAADDYDSWILFGQVLHSLDDSLLEAWDEWSKQSSKYKEGECHKRWLSFCKDGGRTIGSLIHTAKEYGYNPSGPGSQNYKAMNVDDETLSAIALDPVTNLLTELEKDIQKQTHNPYKSNLVQKNKKNFKEQKPRNSSSDVVTDVMIQMYKGNLLFSQQENSFYLYEYRSKGLWSRLFESEIKGDIKNKFELIKQDVLPNGYSMNMINDVLEQLKISLIFDDWYDQKDLLLFTNGILNVETRELIEFKKDLYMTQQLPYDYDPYINCEPIIQWLKDTQDNSWERTQVLRAWLRAVLLSHSEIQKFVEIVGPGKSGKSTYANLAHALVGDENAMISSLEHLEKNRFETANLYKKKLLLFNDVERYGGSVSILKAITGRDLIRNERKFQSNSQKPFKFNGLVIITANEPIQTTDPTSGLARRRLTIPFDKPFKGVSSEQKTLIDMDDKGRPFGEFAPLLPGLVNWLLDMSADEMREYLMETNKKVSFFAKHHREQILKSNQIMDWMSHCLVFDTSVSTVVGLAKFAPGGTDTLYKNSDKWLYASYCEFSRGSNTNILGRSRFESLVLDICAHQLDLNVYKISTSRGMRIANIATRKSDLPKYKNYPSVVELGLNKDKWTNIYGESLLNKSDQNIEAPEEEF
jgi:phage/plasmid-associated DNA primase